jgi:hypothetical protein
MSLTRLEDASRRLRGTAWAMRRSLRWPHEALAVRRAFTRQLGTIVVNGVDCAPPIGLHVVCFSAQMDVPEQVASLRSFLATAGVPARLTIVSDGTHEADVCCGRCIRASK